jgi:type VI secretion system secreted protein VgrG
LSASPAASHASDGVELELAGFRGFAVVGLEIDERVSGRTSARVEITTNEDLPFESSVGEPAKLTLHRATDSEMAQRVWTLDFAEAVFLGHKNRSFRYELSFVDPMWKLGLGRATRKFRNLSATDIVSAVLGEAGIKHRFELAGPPLPVKKYCAQYREDNLTFVERIMELEGIYYRLAEDGTVVFGDASGSADLIAGGRIFELVEAANALRSASSEAVFELRRGARVQSGRVTLGDYNWKKPNVPLRAMGSGDAETYLERFHYPSGYRDPDRGALLAQRRVEAYRAQAHFLEGKGNILSLAPGRGIRIGSLIGYAFSGEYFTTSVLHRLTRIAYQEDEPDVGRGATAPPALTYENRFEGIPRSVPFRPIPRAPRPTVAGSHTAMVRGPSGSEIHTDKYGRFRAQLHWDREATGTDEDSRWLRALQETSSSMVLARTGWEVFIGYIDGDPDRPIGLGRAINGIAPPTYGLPANKNAMTIHTPSSPATGGYSEIKMDDSAGSQKISIRAEKDLDTVVKNDKLEKVGHDETHEVGLNLKRTVAGDRRSPSAATMSRSSTRPKSCGSGVTERSRSAAARRSTSTGR